MSTKAEPGPFDGMAKAEPDEPVFTLRAHDPQAPGIVRTWVELRRKAIRARHAAGEINDAKRDLELIQCREAEEIAWSMDEWRSGLRPVELEPVEEPVPNYSGIQASADELMAKELYDAVKAAGQLMSNAVAAIYEAAAKLEPHGFLEVRAALSIFADRVRLAGKHIAPKRASYYVGEPLPEAIQGEEMEVNSVQLIMRQNDLEAADADPS